MRRIWAALTTTAVTATLLTGCGLGSDTKSDDTVASAAATGEVKGKVSLQTWALKPKFTDYVQGVIDGFKQKYPGVEVQWLDQPGEGYSDKVLSQAAAGTLPDVVNLPPDFALPLASKSLLLDVAKADPKLSDEYVAGGVDAYRFTGQDGTYGYPWYLNTDVNYWNSELLAKYGLDPKNLPTTLDELIAQARVMKEKSGGSTYLMSRKPGLGDLVNAGVKVMADDGRSFTFNTPEAAALLDKYRAAFKEGLLPKDVLTDTYAGNTKLFTAGTAAWTTGGANLIASVATDNPTLAPKMVSSPAMGTPPLYVQGLSIPKSTKNPAAAVALARWVTSPENQARFAHLTSIFPSTKASAGDAFFSKGDGTNGGDAKVVAFGSLAKAKILQPVQVDDAMGTVIKQQIALAISGDATSKQALDTAVERCNQLLKG
ncbi:sugar ABC transporter substrate-binding protein [Streptomyces sp. CB01881]|uniref:ABC transporter substrate-binding protein n=1 Tax=Streptomyces sp. CB01881 TaxID=2078691 RepID=UPI000CDC10A0|nr:sugar ABC transporter substrate-binding protein [Streptomyces sp. CB01881]AUY52803.1 sugar ABC transporter substrate-binding protein [Streptomyces sp. CB01881]TYC70522.1 sugar ABC transporter substrate-binding protein [Streptomyces sp. CB01881]